ncbi:antibiotic biosynthesis monooxygenase family protein [Amycolatopsis nigrescens]|uniref:antibiotic biosynthesis monooxygenase family protein n=1 Tax=Amycolatopsis nigrescens TaxID=381445 RepID=UPI00035C554A|nr:antibiotic biosynthesis monooxygenase family protein [Amycolatopsis nigrescens]
MGGTTGGVRVLIFNATEDVAGIEAAYHEVSKELAGVPGLLGNELLRSVQDPNGFVVLSSWESMAAFQEWEQGADHRRTTTPLRPFRDTSSGRPFGVYQVTAAYE